MATRLPVVRTLRELRAAVRGWRRKGNTIALVPTMGALHPGHLSLVKLARKRANRVVVSIFVNPTQFGPNEDFEAYPRDEQGDWQRLGEAKADLLYAPAVSEIYPDDFSTRVEVIGITSGLEGASRPRHFAGVTTVVTKLFLQCLPDFAVFGEKDFQQLLVIRQLVKDLDMPITIVSAPTLREDDGLALSSRNAYLELDRAGDRAALSCRSQRGRQRSVRRAADPRGDVSGSRLAGRCGVPRRLPGGAGRGQFHAGRPSGDGTFAHSGRRASGQRPPDR